MKKSIKQFPVPMVLKEIFRNRLDGLLVVNGPDYTKQFFVTEGRLEYATTNRKDERLGKVLLDTGKISAGQHALSCKIKNDSPRKVGEILVEITKLSMKDIYFGLIDQIRTITLNTFTMQEGHWKFTSKLPKIPGKQSYKIKFPGLFREGMEKIPNIPYYKKIFYNQSAVSLPIPQPIAQFLSPEEIRFYIKLISLPNSSIGEFVSELTAPHDVFWKKSIFLYLMGVLHFASTITPGMIDKQKKEDKSFEADLSETISMSPEEFANAKAKWRRKEKLSEAIKNEAPARKSLKDYQQEITVQSVLSEESGDQAIDNVMWENLPPQNIAEITGATPRPNSAQMPKPPPPTRQAPVRPATPRTVKKQPIPKAPVSSPPPSPPQQVPHKKTPTPPPRDLPKRMDALSREAQKKKALEDIARRKAALANREKAAVKTPPPSSPPSREIPVQKNADQQLPSQAQPRPATYSQGQPKPRTTAQRQAQQQPPPQAQPRATTSPQGQPKPRTTAQRQAQQQPPPQAQPRATTSPQGQPKPR
ncbi:MAG: hypothetical protein GY765_21015, partial [bacterium]|nr:hypothetical protein [bacterium]